MTATTTTAAPSGAKPPPAPSGPPVSVVQISLDPRRTMAFLAAAILLIWPLAHPPADLLTTAILGCIYLVVTASLVLLIGLVGQISLCQATLVGIGSFVAAIGTAHGLDFPASIVVGMAAGAAAACLVGAVALRVRGLFFAVATLIFAYVADQYLFAQPWLVGSVSGTSIKPEAVGTAGLAPFINLSDLHDFYYIALAAAIFAVYAVANLRDSRLGRAFGAVRGSEMAAVSLGIDLVRTKLVGFAVSGALAGLAGSLLLVGNRTIDPAEFSSTQSLFFLSVAVVGGLRSLGGAVASSTMFAVLIGEVFYRIPAAANYLDLISAGLLIAVLLFFRSGLGGLPAAVRAWWAAQLSRGVRSEQPVATPVRTRGVHAQADTQVIEVAISDAEPPAPAEENDEPRSPFEEAPAMDPSVIGGLIRRLPEAADPLAEAATLLEAEHVTVRFGGLTAVDDAHLKVTEGQIVGLIGPNGAGKTTMFNALLGLNKPQAGTVRLFGHDVAGWAPHRRAALGIARTFQVLQLFPDLTVTDNLLVATYLHDSTGLFSGMFATPAARRREAAARARVATALDALGLSEHANRAVSGLPFGVLRLVEIARTLVTGAPLVCLDEPASGLDSGETEKLIDWLKGLREAGVSLLVIEHDVAMVKRLCDYIYVLDHGKLIAEGTPAEISANKAVQDSYLGKGDDDEAAA